MQSVALIIGVLLLHAITARHSRLSKYTHTQKKNTNNNSTRDITEATPIMPVAVVMLPGHCSWGHVSWSWRHGSRWWSLPSSCPTHNYMLTMRLSP